MVCLALKVMVDGGVPLRTSSVWVTFTFTVSAVAGAGFALIVNVAAVPSVTGDVFAVIVTCGMSLSLTVTVAEDGVPTV